ncbi:endolytic transglycosylase MltG [Lacibacter luteus]|uniref:Endolytic murein transglycosylase n=1 Tax=Lacibacter luteus TaxID=2508719 RepID=A0A4Q1CLG6_9BACT|nr:endolytic transglycosylase MltG [Lacibacter luteus]RXK61535.1 endolytic transglycosylase MltG [Lacibacter luteus]
MKKVIGYSFLILSLIALFFAWKFFGSATAFKDSKKYLYIYTGNANQKAVMQSLKDSGFLKNPALFETVAGRLDVWERLRPGKYEIEKGSSLFTLARKLRNGSQTPVNLVITKLRTRNDFAGLVGRKFESDSTAMLQFMNSNDSLKKFDLDTNTVMTTVFPNTYSLLWNSEPQKIFRKLNEQRTKFWTTERKQKAAALGLTTAEVHTLASIVEEETLRNDEKPTVASVYLNRLNKGMNLGADPTVKFAVGDFSLKRILFGHINSTASSPYNTYRNKGLPPGPICTPSEKTIDAVLNAAKTDYLFFCAKPNGNGYHAFASNDIEHAKNAKTYQQWLDSLNIK